MKKIISCFGASAVLGMLLFSYARAEEPKEILIEVLAIEMSQNVLNEFVSPGLLVINGFPPPDRIDAGKIVRSLESLIKEKKVSLVANPKIKALEGKKAYSAVGKDVLYLEEIDKDTFKLKKLTGKEGAGTFFEATPTITKDGRISVQYELIIQKVQGRAPIEGAEGFNIGYPLLSSRRTSSNVVLNEGQPMALMSGPQVGGQCFLVIFTAKIK